MAGRSDPNPFGGWPRVREVRPGVYRVKGRVVPVLAWLVMRRVAGVLVGLGLLWLLAAACLPALTGLYESLGRGHPVGGLIGTMLDFRFFLRELLTERFPDAGRAIYYTGRNPYDWHLLGVCFVAYWTRPLLGYALCRVLIVLLYPLISKRFKATVYRDMVIVHRLLRTLKIPRTHDVAFGTAGPEYHPGLVGRLLRAHRLKVGQHADYVSVAVYVNHRPLVIATPRRMIDADRIVQSLKAAMR